ncbi:Kelch repeat-containing protein [Kordiimonas aquimaris]|uniref:Kelch repeat-containing protein n=1 Tax=Kordiimonas aquimaris TaxID=707591 RepID=UPI0021D23D54|nr:kelch repeat-containing protein [Kordiimonas aquimaris]
MNEKLRHMTIGVLTAFFIAGGVVADNVPLLPEPHANNAVAQTIVNGKNTLFSFMGLTKGKAYTDISRKAYAFSEGEAKWRALPSVPVDKGRLAATAVGLNGMVYLFGGYTVAEDGAEVSTPENFVFDPITQSYTRIADMPVPSDDAVSFSYASRYIYIVSGWHNTDNIRDVQVYDTQNNSWFKATDYPGSPVFGHAGGIVGNRFVIADGVAVLGSRATGDRRFETVNEGWMGTINPENPAEISYRRLPQLPGRGHYRMGGAGDSIGNRVLFVGGTSNAYNYNGIGYNGEPSKPTKHVFAWDFTKDNWVAYEDKPVASMDHRGLMKVGEEWFTIGGMIDGQIVNERALRSMQ